MSDEWFFESRGRAPRRNWLPVLAIIIIVVVNFGMVAVYVNNANHKVVELNQEVESLTGQIETLRFQLQSANYEISALKDSTQIQGPGNASAWSDLTQIYNQTRMSVVFITVRTRLTSGQGSGFVYDKPISSSL